MVAGRALGAVFLLFNRPSSPRTCTRYVPRFRPQRMGRAGMIQVIWELRVRDFDQRIGVGLTQVVTERLGLARFLAGALQSSSAPSAMLSSAWALRFSRQPTRLRLSRPGTASGASCRCTSLRRIWTSRSRGVARRAEAHDADRNIKGRQSECGDVFAWTRSPHPPTARGREGET